MAGVFAGAKKPYNEIPAFRIGRLQMPQILAQPAADAVTHDGSAAIAGHQEGGAITKILIFRPRLKVQSKIIRLIPRGGFKYLRDHFSAFKAMAGQTIFSF